MVTPDTANPAGVTGTKAARVSCGGAGCAGGWCRSATEPSLASLLATAVGGARRVGMAALISAATRSWSENSSLNAPSILNVWIATPVSASSRVPMIRRSSATR